MLEIATNTQLDELVSATGIGAEKITISSLRSKTLIVVTTQSRNIYLFEIVRPEMCLAHVVRYKDSFQAHRGYKGLRYISQEFCVGERIVHGAELARYSWTSPIAEIVILGIYQEMP
ncbi:MAG: hypothetical protein HZA35_00205 [Parcubacteria group bacterium]|nr:hypothetical protein [Parcubacteria group bacterium]